MSEFIGQNIKTRREDLRMTQEELAKSSGISRQTISALENGKCENALVGTLLSICKALDTTIDNFFCIDRPND